MHDRLDQRSLQTMLCCMQKNNSVRIARASAVVHVGHVAFQLIEANQIKKGDVLSTAQLAGIMAAKHTSTLIPLCHNLFISKADVQLHLLQDIRAVQVLPTYSSATAMLIPCTPFTCAAMPSVTDVPCPPTD